MKRFLLGGKKKQNEENSRILLLKLNMHYLNNKEFQGKEIMAEAKVPIKHIRLEKLEHTTECRCILQQKHSRHLLRFP